MSRTSSFSNWWKKWEIYVLPSLLPNRKWKMSHPKIKSGTFVCCTRTWASTVSPPTSTARWFRQSHSRTAGSEGSNYVLQSTQHEGQEEGSQYPMAYPSPISGQQTSGSFIQALGLLQEWMSTRLGLWSTCPGGTYETLALRRIIKTVMGYHSEFHTVSLYEAPVSIGPKCLQ